MKTCVMPCYKEPTSGIVHLKMPYEFCGCGVHKEIQKYANNNLLSEMIELGEKYHLVPKSKIPNDVVERIEEILTIEHMP